MPVAMVVVRSLSDQKFVSCLIMGILKKNPPHFGPLPHSPSYPSLCPPQMKFAPYPKNVLDLCIRKSTVGEEIWNMLQNIPKASSMMSSFQDNAYI